MTTEEKMEQFIEGIRRGRVYMDRQLKALPDPYGPSGMVIRGKIELCDKLIESWEALMEEDEGA